MPTVVTNDFRQSMATSGVNLSADSYKASLMGIHVNSASVATLMGQGSWTEVSGYEVSGTGYSALDLTATTVSANAGNVVLWDGTDLTWGNMTVSPYGLSIYRPSDNLVLGYLDFGEQKVAVNGPIVVQWNTNGIMNIYGQ